MDTLASRPLDLQYLLQNLDHVKELSDDLYRADCPVPSPGLPHSVIFGQDERGITLTCQEGVHSQTEILDAISGVGLPVLQAGRKGNWHPFPDHAIPSSLLKLATEASIEGGYPPEFVIVPGLSVLAGAIGATYAIRFATNWIEYPILWTGIVASPGAGKSPALSLVTRPIKDFDLGTWSRWKEEHSTWAEFEKKKKKSDDSEAEPILRRTLCSNITMEAQVELLAENPRGLLRSVDEVAEVMSGLNQYKGNKGSDRQQILTMWSGDQMSRDRIKSNGPVIIRTPVCSITGGMQPSKVRDFLAGDDGMAERWLLGHFTDIQAERTGPDSSEVTTQAWNALILKCLDIEYTGNPKLCSLTAEARQLWDEAKERNRKRYNESTSDRTKDYWRKLDRHTARLIVALHVADALDRIVNPERMVHRETVENAIHIAEWFADQYMNNLPREENLMEPPGLKHRDEAVDTLRQFILRKGGVVSRKDIQMGKPAGARSPKLVDQLLAWYSEVYPEDVVNNQFYAKENLS